MTPTTDTVQGWLVLAMLALLLICVIAGALAIWDAVLHAHAKRVEFDRQMARQRELAFGYCQVIDVDGRPIRIQSDRELLDDTDRAAVEHVVRLIRQRLHSVPDWREARP